MKINSVSRLFAILILLCPSTLTAGEDQELESETKTENSQEGKTIDTPKTERLEQKKLGDAFERFVPTEDISVENAVPFPVDI